MSNNKSQEERDVERAADMDEEMDQNGHPGSEEEAGEDGGEELTEVERLENELSEMEDKFMRKTAEFENFRRRMRQARRQAEEEGRMHVISRFLDVLDDFDRSMEAAAQAEEDHEGGPAFDTLKEGVELVYKKFTEELAKLGVERIEAADQPFDEEEHEAMMQRSVPDVESGTVVQVIQPGYRLGDRIIRHAKVIVAE
jgi:molecular chaperone GrpE